jgi:hypothetical protein
MAIRFLRNSLLGAFAILAVAGWINYTVDPFQQYRVPSKYEGRFYRAFQRHENPGVARNYDYTRAVLGSSFLENISGSEADRAFGSGKTMNLCISALTAYEARKMLEVMLATGKLKQVIYNVDYNSFSGDPKRTGLPEPLPLYLYDAQHWNDYPYVLSLTALRKSLNIMMGRTEIGYRTDRDKPWYWADDETFGAKRVTDGMDPHDMNGRFKQPLRTLDGMMRSFDENLEPLVRDNPQVEFIFVWPPYSILVWADFVQRGQLDVSLEFKRKFFERLSKYPNARIHDFQARMDWITDLEQYRDMYHFGPKISSAMVTAIAKGDESVTPDNIGLYITKQRDIAVNADPVKIIAAAQATPEPDKKN